MKRGWYPMRRRKHNVCGRLLAQAARVPGLMLGLALGMAPGHAHAVDPEGAEIAARYAFAHGAVAFLVLHGDDILVERYAEGIDPTRLQMLFSGGKSFSCAIGAAAVDEGLLEWDAPVERYIEEWRGAGRSGITIRNLLSLDSGLDPVRSDGRDSPLTTRQTVSSALQARILSPPGRRFSYGHYPFLVFSEVVRRATGREAGEYLALRVLGPISARAEWLPTADGHTHLADGALMAPRDWLSFGKLVRDGGRWEGRQVLGEATLAECFKPSRSNRRYGMGWWLDSGATTCRSGDDARRDGRPCMVSARGRYSNALHVLPQAGLVVVVIGRNGGAGEDEIDQQRLLRALLARSRD